MPKLKIKEIRLRNFGPFIDEKLDFSGFKYPVLVLGDNGAGKTVFFVDSITYSFFGSAYGHGNPGVKRVSRLHRGGSVEAVVLLESDDGRILEVRNKKVAKLNPRVESPGIDVLTGHDDKTLLSTYIVRQGEVAEILRITPAERRSYLVKLLGYRFGKIHEKVKNEKDLIEKEINSLLEKKSEIEGMFKSLGLDEVSETLLNDKLKEEVNKENEIKNEINNLKERLNNLRSELERKSIDKQELVKLLNDIKRLKEIRGKITSSRKKLAEYCQEPDEINGSIVNNLKEIVEETKKIVDKIDILKDKQISLTSIITQAKNILEKFNEDRLNKLDILLNDLTSRSGALNSELAMLEDRLEKLSQPISECPVCGSPLDEEHKEKLIKETKELIANARNELSKVNSQILEVRKERGELERFRRNIEKLTGSVENIMQELSSELNIEVSEVTHVNLIEMAESLSSILENHINSLKKDLMGYINEVKVLGFKIDISLKPKKIVDRLSKLVDVVEKVLMELNRLDALEKDYASKIGDLDEDEVNRRMNELSLEIKNLEKEIEKVEKEMEELNRELGAVQSRIKSLNGLKPYLQVYGNYQNKIKQLERKHEIYSDLVEIFKEGSFPAYLINEVVIPRLNELINSYLEEFNTNFRVEFVVSNTTIDVKVLEGRVERYLNSLSGGEMTLIGLAFRLAFGRLISSLGMNYFFDFLILDEALTHLDENNKRIVVERLVKMVEDKVISQVIIITHDQTIQDLPFLDGSIVKVVKEAGVSRVYQA